MDDNIKMLNDTCNQMKKLKAIIKIAELYTQGLDPEKCMENIVKIVLD